MSSREFDGALDALFRQALQPFAEAAPPAAVWRRVLRAVRPAPFSRWSWILSRLNGIGLAYAPPLRSGQPYCIDPGGRYHPPPLWGVHLNQMFDLRLTS